MREDRDGELIEGYEFLDEKEDVTDLDDDLDIDSDIIRAKQRKRKNRVIRGSGFFGV
jgi:hypothetical protein